MIHVQPPPQQQSIDQRIRLTFAFCTYNRAARLERLVAAMRAQDCSIPFEILAVNNNSQDETLKVLNKLIQLPGRPLRVVTEAQQGIVPARNRAITEAMQSDILVFIDDDELPLPGMLKAACHAILNEGAQCAGGKVTVDFSEHERPAWLEDGLLGFLAEVNHGDTAFWISDTNTPVWTANVAYDVRIFRENFDLRFDTRYNRLGAEIGGGEDAVMLRSLLARRMRVRYRPDMMVLHSVEPWRLKRSYFLRLHYHAGVRAGQYQISKQHKTIFGIPPFLIRQFLVHTGRAISKQLMAHRDALRQAMNAAHALGNIQGYRHRELHSESTPEH